MSNPHIDHMREIAALYDVADICSEVLDAPGFDTWTASPHPNLHHYGTGGLAMHTYEVLSLCLANQTALASFAHPMFGPVIDPKVLVCAAIHHDYGKLTDYRPADRPSGSMEPRWESTEDKALVYHITRSAIHWSKAVDRHPRHKPLHDDVLHCILSHHGLRQWGSPVEPRTRAAWVLHLSDQMSARVNDADTLHLPR